MDAVKSTKRVSIVGIALDLFYMKISTIPAGARSTFAPFFEGWTGQKCACARSFDDQVRDRPQAGLSDSNFQEGEEEKIAENPNNLRTSNTDGALIDEIGKFDIHDDSDFANGITVGNDHDRGFSSSEGPMDDCSAKSARIPLPGEFQQSILRILRQCLLASVNP